MKRPGLFHEAGRSLVLVCFFMVAVGFSSISFGIPIVPTTCPNVNHSGCSAGGGGGDESGSGPSSSDAAASNCGCDQPPPPPPGTGGAAGPGKAGGGKGGRGGHQGSTSFAGIPSGDPAEVGRGIYVGHVIDFKVPVKYGLSLGIERLYASVNYIPENLNGETMFGPYWWCPYEARVYYNDDAGATHPYEFISETGSWHHFSLDSGSTYYSRLDQGTPYKLDVDSGSTTERYKITEPKGRQLRFNSNGRLTSIEANIRTAAEEKIIFTYNSNGHLWKVAAPGSDDRYLEFTYWMDGSTELHQVKTVAFRTSTLNSTVMWYWYEPTYGQLDFVKANDINNANALFYEYGNLNASNDTLDTIDPPLLGRLSYYSSGTRKGLTGIKYTGVSGSNYHYLHPTDLYMWDVSLGTPAWVQTTKIGYTGGYLRDLYHDDGQGGDPQVTYVVDFQRDYQDAWYTNLSSSNSRPSTRTDPRDHTNYGDGENDPRIRESGSRKDPSDSTWHKEWAKTFDLSNSDKLYRYRVLTRTTYGAKNEGTAMTTTNSYQAYTPFKGILRSVTSPTGEVTTWKYFGDQDNNGSLDSGIDSSDHRYGRLAEVVAPGNISTTYTYHTTGDDAGLLASVTTPDGTTEYEYNSRGEVWTITSPDGTVVTKSYNPYGQTTAVQITHLGTTTYTYSDDTSLPSGERFLPPRLVKVVDEDDNETHFYYNETREVSEIKDPLNKSTYHTYDLRGRLATTYRSVGGSNETVTYGYDKYDLLVSFKDGRNKETTYEYDEFGRMTKETDPDSYYTQYWYGASGGGGCSCSSGGADSIARLRKQDGAYVSFSYDWAGRLKEVDYENLGSSGSYELTYTYDNGSRILTLSDTRLDLGGETYTWAYDTGSGSGYTGRLLKLTHPEGHTQEYFYDSEGQIEAYRDPDGGLIEYAYDSLGRLDTLTDPFLAVADWTYATTSDTSYPVGAVKVLEYGNDSTNNYAYDSLGRLDTVTFKDPSAATLDFVDLAYNAAGLITQKARRNPSSGTDHRITYYTYDDAYRLTEEQLKIATTVKDTRSYGYDAAGNRDEMTKNGNYNTYSYGNRNQITSNTNYYTLGSVGSGSTTYNFASKGNMTYRGMNSQPSMEWGYNWNEDNRLTSVTYSEDHEQLYTVDYKYDAAGRRLLKRGRSDQTGVRTRYFFHGLTEEIKKQSVPNSHADSAFAYTEKEDGVSSSDWTAVNSGSVTALSDTPRRSSVIRVTSYISTSGGAKLGSSDWNSTERVLSFWSKAESGSAPQLNVAISTSGGTGYVVYLNTSGTNTYNAGLRAAYIYLNGTLASTSWIRVQRNIEADFESVSGATIWTNTDSVTHLPGGSSKNWYIDMIRLSNSLTSEHTVLGPGVIGHILRDRTINTSTYAATDHYFHYDQVGSVMLETNSSGASAATPWPDAFGLLTEGWSGSNFDGHWKNAAGQAGWHFQSKEFDEEAGLAFYYQRWLLSELNGFISVAPLPPMEEHKYSFGICNPVNQTDPLGMTPDPAKCDAARCAISKNLATYDDKTGTWKYDSQYDTCLGLCAAACSTNARAGLEGAFMSRCFNACLKSRDCVKALTFVETCIIQCGGRQPCSNNCLKAIPKNCL